jgi:arylamine N-acetyltransferase
VTLSGIEYLVDVGFPHTGLTAPMPIYDGKKIIETPIDSVVPAQNRVQMTEIRDSRRPGSKFWTVQQRATPSEPWKRLYVFQRDTEAFDADMEL